MLTSDPWGIRRELLKPSKVFADPVHGDIYLNRLEVMFVDSPPMQRLRRVRQLGTTCLVYPAATHTRFSHSLGALRAVQDLLDAVWDQRLRPKATAGQLDDWHRANELDAHFARATVLARLGGLLHDLCHLPFGHSIEDDLKLVVAHDENEDRFDALWDQMPEALHEAVSDELLSELKPLIVSKANGAKEHRSEYPWVADIVGNTICADLIDYLPRDHLYTGLPIALGHRFLESFYVTPQGGGTKQQRMALMLNRDGHERLDVATELLKYLRYRYELSERALVHHAKLAADAMVGRLLEAYWAITRDRITRERWIEAGRPADDVTGDVGLEQHAAAWREASVERSESINREVRSALEQRLLRHGDDGLLEYFAELTRDGSEGEMATIAELTRRLLDRQLYKLVGRCSPRDVTPSDLYDAFGRDKETRRSLEQAAATWAGIADTWKLILWLPPAGMRLKPADVLVSDGSSVRRFVDYERPTGRRGSEIYRAHENLWSAGVYVAHDLKDDPRIERALVWLASEMDVRWEQLAPRYSTTPANWPVELFQRELRDMDDASPEDVIAELFDEPLPRRSRGNDSFESQLASYRAAARRRSKRKT